MSSAPSETTAPALPALLVSTYKRAGYPVLYAWGARLDGDRIRVPMLYVSAQIDAIAYHLHDPDDAGRTPILTVRLPADLVDLSADKHVQNATLEVIL